MPDIRAQDEKALASVKAIYDAAEQAKTDAQRAHDAADEAEGHAQTALTNAATAKAAADEAQEAADKSLLQLSIIEDVAGTLDWIQNHGTYTLTTDTSVQESKIYFVKNGDDYEPVVNPTGDPHSQGWYVLDLSDSQSDYIMAHLAVTSRGLWVLPSGMGSASDAQYAPNYKALLSSSGLLIYDGNGALVSTFGENITFSATRGQRIGGTNNYIEFDPATGRINIVGNGVYLGAKAAGDVATTSQMNAAIDGIEVGGRNLLKESDLSVNMNIGYTERFYTENGWWRFSGTLSLTSASRHALYAGFGAFGTQNIAGAGTYTLTNWAENLSFSSTTMYIRVYIYSDSAGTNTRSFNCTSANSSITFTVPEGEHVSGICLYFNTASSGTSLDNASLRLKLEKGNKATDWTPAPEDRENAGGRNYAKTNKPIGTSSASNGITATLSDYATITLDGTNTSASAFIVLPDGATAFGGLTLGAGTYKIWFTNTSGTNIWPRIGKGTSAAYLYSKEGEYSKGAPFILNVIEEDVYYIGIAVKAGASFSSFTTSVMWERCTVTDFSPAPEDVDAYTDDVVSSLSDSLTDSISQMSTELTGKIDEAMMLVNSKADSSALNNLTLQMQEYIGEGGYIYAANNGTLIIATGENVGNFKIGLTGQQIVFYENDIAVAYIEGKRLYISRSEVTDEQKISNFAFKKRDDGRFTLMYVGG